MPMSLEVYLKTEEDCHLNNSGEALHGWLFNIIREDTSLHSSRKKFFSLSPLRGNSPTWRASTTLRADEKVCFRLNILQNASARPLVERLIKLVGKGEVIELEHYPFTLLQVRKPLRESSQLSYAQLQERAPLSRKLTLRFITPTSFRLQGHQSYLFPEPSMVFTSLMDKWNSFSPVQFPNSYKTDFATLLVTEHHMRTELVNFRNYKLIGFRGRVSYTLPRELARPLVKAINILAEFSRFSGVGYKTTMGMGLTARVK